MVWEGVSEMKGKPCLGGGGKKQLGTPEWIWRTEDGRVKRGGTQECREDGVQWEKKTKLDFERKAMFEWGNKAEIEELATMKRKGERRMPGRRYGVRRSWTGKGKGSHIKVEEGRRVWDSEKRGERIQGRGGTLRWLHSEERVGDGR